MLVRDKAGFQSGSNMIQPVPMRSVTTITLRQLLEAQPALQRLSAEKLPVKVAYNVARMLKELQPEIDEFNKQRTALVERHGTRRKASETEKLQHGDEVIEVLKDKFEAYRKDVDDLIGVVITIRREPLKLDGLPDITPADLLVLEPLLEE